MEVCVVDQLVNEVSQRTGLGEATSRQAVQVVIGYLKGRLPEPFGGMVDQFVGGGQPGQTPDLGSLFGGGH
ncbi:hypothetical protein [Candidatus Dormiibacter inghamiae]|uniref:hypothetical protein n=1 Tax=Candidatus Dormiibacter inghamiae TaxID=3127013 RepID=UPI0030C6899F